MKKILTFITVLTILSAAVFAQKFTVKSIKGKAFIQTGSSKKELKAGQTIDGKTIIAVDADSSVTFESEGKTYIARAQKKGAVTEIAAERKQLKKGNSINNGKIASNVDKVHTAVTTASGRGDPEDEDEFEWQE